MGHAWRPLSAGSRASATGTSMASPDGLEVSLCGGMELADGSVSTASTGLARSGPMFAPCFATMLYPVTYPQLVGPAAQTRRKRRPQSAGPALTRSGTIGSGSQTRFVRELKPDTSTSRRRHFEVSDTSDAAVDPEATRDRAAFRLSVREREARASDDRGTNRHRFRSIDRSSNGDGVFATSTATFTARIRPDTAAEPSATEHSRSNVGKTQQLPRRRTRAAGTQRRNYTSKVTGIGFRGNQRGQSLLLDAMARRTIHEAGQLMERNMCAVEEALMSRCPIDTSAWSSLQECRMMYQELLETDEGGMSSVVASLGRLNSLISLLRGKGLVPASGATHSTEDTSSVIAPVG